MVMEDLTDDKKVITDTHLTKMVEAHEKMAKMIDEAMKEAKTKGSGGVDFLSKLKAMITIDWTKTLKIPDQDMLQYSTMWFDLTKRNFDLIMSISKEEYSSLLKGIDDQLLYIKQQIEKIDEELRDVNDEEKHQFLQIQKQKWVSREW